MKRLLRSAALREVGGRLLGRYLRFALATARWRVLGQEHIAPFLSESVIIAFWHERLALMPKVWLHFRAVSPRRDLRCTAMVSRHRDGQLIGTVLAAFGLELISASSNNGGAAGMRAALDRLAGGGHLVAIVPDGPRGPARVPAPGVAAIAALSGAAILPCAAILTPCRRLGGWDRMVFPFPFGRATLLFGPPIRVKRRGAAEALPGIAAALDDVTARVDALHAGSVDALHAGSAG